MNLVLLANGFPYGNWEPYLETEVKYYRDFDAVHICSMQLIKAHRDAVRPLPSDKFHVCPVPFASMAVYFFGAFRALADGNFYAELWRLIKRRRFTPARLAWLLFYVSRSHHEARIIRKYLKKAGVIGSGEKTVLYSYRFDYQPYAALLLKKYLPGCKVVARAHGYDLYEENHPAGYIAMRPYLLEKLDEVILIAENGLRYLAEKYPARRDKLSLRRLGTGDHGAAGIHMDGSSIRLVSCSTFTPVKRVELIVQALAGLDGLEVFWTHYGEGPLMPEVQKLCRALPNNVHYELRGYVDNAVMLREYGEKPFHLFLNVSASEGVPVSIMEALSFGAPCIATDVGGNSEIVKPGQTGVLLDADFSPEELAGHIRAFAAMPDGEYQLCRRRARDFWLENYSAEKNYADFTAHLLSLGRD